MLVTCVVMFFEFMREIDTCLLPRQLDPVDVPIWHGVHQAIVKLQQFNRDSQSIFENQAAPV